VASVSITETGQQCQLNAGMPAMAGELTLITLLVFLC